MNTPPYIHFRIPGLGRVTLSCPAGVRRALETGRLAADSEVWMEVQGDWLPMGRHLEVARLMGSTTSAPAKPVAVLPEDELVIERFSADHLAVRDEPVDSCPVHQWASAL
jgi:hypothetical protein